VNGKLAPLREGMPAAKVQALLDGGDGTVWAGSSKGVVRVDRGATAAVAVNDGLLSRAVRVLGRASDGSLWAGLSDGLAHWNGQSWRPAGGLPPLMVDALWGDQDGSLWVGSRGNGLWHGKDDRWEWVKELGTAPVRALLRDRRGHLWVATRGGLFWQQGAGGGFRAQALPATACGTRIGTLAEDAERGLWLATDGCGVHRLQDRAFRTFSVQDGMPADDLLGLAAGPDGAVWAGTRRGPTMRWRGDPSTAQALACPEGLSCNGCWDFSAGATGQAWMVCAGQVALRWNGHALGRATLLPGLTDVSFVIGPSDGSVWMARREKVVRQGVDGESAPVLAQEELRGTRILYEGRAGTIWIVAANGVARWRAGQVRVVRLPEADRPVEPSNVVEDAEGSLWIGTKGEGLRRLHDDRIDTIGVGAGVPTGWIVQPIEDGRGRLWVSSAIGIFWVKKSELVEVTEGRRARVQVNLYDGNDGVQMRSEHYGHPAGFADAQGRLWFATSSGAATVDPSSLHAAPPRPVLAEVRVGGQRLEPGGGIAAGPAPRDLDVSFSAVSFAAPDTISFRHRLEGWDRDWVESGSLRSAHYPRLEAGKYRLLVEARQRESDWSPVAAGVAFELQPPFFRSPLFLLAVGLVGGMALLLAHRLRLAQTRAGLQAVLGERARIARDLHDTLAQAFAATSVQLECLEEALERGERASADRHLATARKVVEESLDEARRAVWVLRPQTIEQGLAPALETLVKRVSGGTPVELEVTGQARILAPAVASHLLRIAHEAVANARRHGRASHIRLRLGFAADSIVLTIADDGQGMSGERPDDGTGIVGMKERAAEMGGVLTIDSGPERGTTVRVEVPA
jgi:signal transduction histidine kinase/ligand-binding sensor domain-containing protein